MRTHGDFQNKTSIASGIGSYTAEYICHSMASRSEATEDFGVDHGNKVLVQHTGMSDGQALC